VRLHIGLFNVQAKTHLMPAGMSAGGTEEIQLGGWDAEVPASTGGQTQSGRWSDGNGMKITWNLLYR